MSGEGGAAGASTNLHRLAKAGDVRELKTAFKKAGRGAIDKKDEWDQTPLHVGCFEGHLAVVKYLVDNKKFRANVHARDKNNWTPLHAAASGLTADHVRICAVLLDKGADPLAKTNDGSSPLHYFVRMDPKSAPEFPKVLLRMATGGGEGDKERSVALRATPQTRKNVNSQNCHGESPLHHAATKGREQSAIYLYQLGADVNVCKYGETSLVVAIRAARPDMVRLLLSLGADPTISSDAGTPMELAKSTGVEEIISTLIEFTHVAGMPERVVPHPDISPDRETKKAEKTSDKVVNTDAVSAGGTAAAAVGFGFGFIVPTDEEDRGRRDANEQASPRAPSDNDPDGKTDGEDVGRTADKAALASVCAVCSTSSVETEDQRYHFHARWPAAWEQVRAQRRQGNPSEHSESNEGQNRLSLDLCCMSHGTDKDDKAEQVFFLRALIHIPLITSHAPSPHQTIGSESDGLTWGVWIKVKEDDFNWIVAAWRREGRENEERAKEGLVGELATHLPCYTRDTLSLPAKLQIRAVGLRPLALITAEHPLATQQRSGITKKKLNQLVATLTQPTTARA